MSSVSLVRDALWERALASQPEPLVRALRAADLDDPAVLLNYRTERGHHGTGSGGAFGRRFSDPLLYVCVRLESGDATEYGHVVLVLRLRPLLCRLL